ncbi:hypothetical protein [Burkholderia sp. WSM2230]|uniref:hypothetical protein n=1 Tax=Burkholderia sp. WSM2230 TaxID=944435 RepID=UPI0004207DCE
MEGFNYTPYNLDRFVITDKFGNKAGGGGDLMPGSGEGRLSCCYTLKGTEFTVEWYVVDQDEFLKDPYGPLKEIHKVSHVNFPPTALKGGAGERIIGLHFYPDDHIEFEFRRDLSGTRILYADVWDWLRKNHGKLLNPQNEDDGVVFRRTARLAATGWILYRLTDTRDLEQYVYFALLNPKFDEHPAVHKILADSQNRPGAFGVAMDKLSPQTIAEIKTGKVHRVLPGGSHD